MTVALRQEDTPANNNASGTTITSNALVSAALVGSVIEVWVAYGYSGGGNPISSVVDSAGQTYSLIGYTSDVTDTSVIACYAFTNNASNTALTATATWSTPVTFINIHVREITGAKNQAADTNAFPVRFQGTNATNGLAVALTTTGAASLISGYIAAVAGSGSEAAGTGFTGTIGLAGGGGFGGLFETQRVTLTGSNPATWTDTVNGGTSYYLGGAVAWDEAATGTQTVTQTVLYAGSGFSLQQGASPAVAVGDTFTAPLTVSPAGYTLQVNNDGTIEVFSGGNTSRQSFTYTRHILASNTTDGPATCWVNEVPPAWSRGVYVSTLVVGIPIAPINLTAYCSSASGDTLVFSLASGTLPSGLTLSAGVISGTPTAAGTSNFMLSAIDYAGFSTLSPASTFVVASSPINVPAAITTWMNNAGALVSWFSGSYILYNGVAPGTFGKYVGLTVNSNGCIYQLNALDMDYKLRARWT